MFRVFVFSICLFSSIWSAFVIYSLTEPKDDLSPNTVFSTKDNSVLIINRPEQYKWENADFVTLNENKIKAQALLPYLNSSFSIYISEQRPLILIESSNNWTIDKIKELFSLAKVRVKFAEKNQLQIEDFEGIFKANKLLLYKDQRLLSQKSFNLNEIDPYSTFSKIFFYDKNPIITSSYVRNSRVIEYQITNSKIKTSSKLVNDLDVFSGYIPTKSKSYKFYESNYLLDIDNSFSKSPISKLVKTGIVQYQFNGVPVLTFDFLDGGDPIMNLNEILNVKEDNKSNAFFRNILISDSLLIKKDDLYFLSYNSFAFVSKEKKVLDDILTEIKLAKTWRFNESEMKRYTSDMPKLVNTRTLSDLYQSASVFIGNKQLKTNVSISSKEEILNTEINYITINPQEKVIDFVTFNDAGNMIYVTNKTIVAVENGKIIWRKILTGKLINGIQKTSISQKGEHFLKVVTSNEVHIFDKNGVYLNKYPLKTSGIGFSGAGVFYKWNSKNYFAISTFANELLVFNNKGVQITKLNIPDFDDWRNIDVYAKASILNMSITGRSNALIIDLTNKKIIDTIKISSISKFVDWKNGTRMLTIDSSKLAIVNEKAQIINTNVNADAIMNVYGKGENALVFVKDKQLLKLINLKGVTLFSKSSSVIDPVHACHHVNSKGEKLVSFVDGIDNNVYLYNESNEIHPKAIVRGQKKVCISNSKGRAIFVTTLLDNKIIQYIIN